MASNPFTPASSATSTSSFTHPSYQAWKHQRVLSCTLCQQKKIKCDRKVPCNHCIRTQSKCVPSTMTPRRRRFPERELLERLRKYERLLRENKVRFEPLHQARDDMDLGAGAGDGDHDDDQDNSGQDVPMTQGSSPASTAHTERPHDIRSIWKAMSGKYAEAEHDGDTAPDELRDDLHDAVIHAVCENSTRVKGNYLFGSANRSPVQLSTLHPSPAQIFRLWHVYLENVNPLLGLTHAPTLQRHVVDAACNVASLDPNFEALLFGIYCMAVISLDSDECVARFGHPRDDLLRGYQFGCQEALLSADFLRTRDRSCLIALVFYLMSIRSTADPQSLASLLGIANRIARRIGIHSESKFAKCSILDAQMGRRLWWVLVLFDARVGELAEFQPSSLSPIWDCNVPLNVNDHDLRSDMKLPPASRDTPTEAMFAVVRATIGDFVRNSAFHLDFTNPALNTIAKRSPNPEHQKIAALERMIEEKYLRHCDPENPFHCMTIWTARAFFAKYQLMEDYWKYLNAPEPPTDAQRDVINLHACQSLERDTTIFRSPLCKGYLWVLHVYFPFPAYIQLFQDMKKRPFSPLAERAWLAIGDNYTARHIDWARSNNHMFGVFSKLVLHTWEARVAGLEEAGHPPEEVPHIVTVVKQKEDPPLQSQGRRNSGPAIGLGNHGPAAAGGNAGHPTAGGVPFCIANLVGDARTNTTALGAISGWETYENLNMPDFDASNMDWWFKDILGANQNW